MPENIAVVYEKGILRPLKPLRLPEQTQLEIRIIEKGATKGMDVAQAYQVLVDAGLVQTLAQVATEPVTEMARLEAANAYGQAGALSAWIIRERDEE
jgi:predicted DNA-binding antitoxin AbrB/MazE fold protein